MKKYLGLIPATLVAATALSVPATSSAGNLMNPYPPVFCGSTGCNSLTETKLYQVSHPVTFQTFAKFGECLRVEVTDTGFNDVALTIVTPDMTAYYMDNNANNYEGMYIRNLNDTGSYTIVFGHWLAAGVGSRANVDVGRYYSSDGTNCPLTALRSSAETPAESRAKDLGLTKNCASMSDCRAMSAHH